MNILKFVAVIVALSLIYAYVPYGGLICLGVNLVALWKLVNEK